MDAADVIAALSFFRSGEKCTADQKNVWKAVIKVINLIDKNTSKLLMSPHRQ